MRNGWLKRNGSLFHRGSERPETEASRPLAGQVRRLSRRSLLAAGLACALGLAGLSGRVGVSAAQPGARADRHVVLVSIDGFAADYWDDPRLPIPNLRGLAAEGARADRMTVSTPSVTWPNHTTLLTGASPARHGVLANGRIEPAGGGAFRIEPRRSKQELCRAETLYDAAHAAGLKTAEINWPVTRGAPTLDFSFPDHPDALSYTTPRLVRELRELRILQNPAEAAFDRAGPVMRDEIWTQAAIHVLRRHRPNLLLLHLLYTDGAQHEHGPQTTEAYAALALADRQLGDVLRAIRESGLRERTTVFVAADHGFVRTTRRIAPNVRLREAGLIRPAAAGESAGPGGLVYDAHVISEGGIALVYAPAARQRPELRARVRAALSGIEGVEGIVEPEEYARYGLPRPGEGSQGPDFVLAARDGYAFSGATTGPLVSPTERPSGTHGYLQTNPRVDAIFAAGGRGIRRGVRLQRVRNLDVAPTIARLLGLRLRDAEGRPIGEILAP